MKLTDLRVNHVEEPLGFQLKPVSFSWVVTEPGTAKKQKAVRIRVFENKETIFDSGYDEKADNRDYPAELSLKPKTRYTWSVEVMADNGETAEAESWFETGKMEEPWTGKWITPELDPAIQPILRKNLPWTERRRLPDFISVVWVSMRLISTGRKSEANIWRQAITPTISIYRSRPTM